MLVLHPLYNVKLLGSQRSFPIVHRGVLRRQYIEAFSSLTSTEIGASIGKHSSPAIPEGGGVIEITLDTCIHVQ